MNIIITEEEIKSRPNYYELGKFVSEKYWNFKDEFDSNKPVINFLEEGIKSSKINPNYTSEDGFDRCIICGKKTPYFTTAHISNRIGYVEGAGQGCYKPEKCNNNL